MSKRRNQRNKTFVLLSRRAGTWSARVFWQRLELGHFEGSLEFCTDAIEKLAADAFSFLAPGSVLNAMSEVAR